MRVVSRSHCGLVRQQNEDSLYAPRDMPEGLLAVADGMGGHNAGEVASALCIETVVSTVSAMRADDAQGIDMVRASFAAANRAVLRASREAGQDGMGTTLTIALMISPEGLIIGHVGDSRAYRYGNGMLQRLTRDHSLVEELVRLGEIDAQEAEQHPQRNIITRAIGTSPSVRVDTTRVHLGPNDCLLLCSDGLTLHLSEDEIATLLRENANPEVAADELLYRVLSRGAHDNVTFIIAVNETEDAI